MTDVKTTEREGNKPGRRRKKNLRTKDMTDVKTSIYLWTKDVTNIRCHVRWYWEQEFEEPMGTYLAHHWLVSETVVVDKKNTNVEWVFDFFVILICSDYLEEKKQNERTIGFGYLKIFRIKRITGLGYFIKKNKITKSLKNRSGKCEGPAGGDWRVKEPEWEMRRTGRGGARRVKEPEWEMRRTGWEGSTG